METLFNNLFKNSGQAFALYLYRRIARKEIQKNNLDAETVAIIAQDFIQFGTATTAEGQALESIVLDVVHVGAPTLTVADVTPFMVMLGQEMAVDYPATLITP